MRTNSIDCLDHPLSILCRCNEYKNIVKNFHIYTVGTFYYQDVEERVKKLEAERLKFMQSLSKSSDDVDKLWIPAIPDLVSFKYVEV